MNILSPSLYATLQRRQVLNPGLTHVGTFSDLEID
jgi:hypothetical protein